MSRPLFMQACHIQRQHLANFVSSAASAVWALLRITGFEAESSPLPTSSVFPVWRGNVFVWVYDASPSTLSATEYFRGCAGLPTTSNSGRPSSQKPPRNGRGRGCLGTTQMTPWSPGTGSREGFWPIWPITPLSSVLLSPHRHQSAGFFLFGLLLLGCFSALLAA